MSRPSTAGTPRRATEGQGLLCLSSEKAGRCRQKRTAGRLAVQAGGKALNASRVPSRLAALKPVQQSWTRNGIEMATSKALPGSNGPVSIQLNRGQYQRSGSGGDSPCRRPAAITRRSGRNLCLSSSAQQLSCSLSISCSLLVTTSRWVIQAGKLGRRPDADRCLGQ